MIIKQLTSKINKALNSPATSTFEIKESLLYYTLKIALSSHKDIK